MRRCHRAAVGMVGVALLLLGWAGPARAGKADVLAVKATQEQGDCWIFDVTVRHEDRGADHWADWWRVRTSAGQELGRRVLLHSHEGEQPFTRDERICVPAGVTVVVVEAHDKVHGLGGATVTVDLCKSSGSGYTVRRRP